MAARIGRRWAVLGGGVLGMRLAGKLAETGDHVELFESAPALGGLAGVWTIGDFTWDKHYHVMLRSDRHLLALLDELDLKQETRWSRTRAGFYSGGRLHSLSDALDFLRFPLLGPFQKLRLAATILRAAQIRDWRTLERTTVSSWLIRWSGRATYERIWLPLLRAKLGEGYRTASAAFIWATIARLYGARRTEKKREEFGFVTGGYSRILERFQEGQQNCGSKNQPSHGPPILHELPSTTERGD
ncbi:MAG: FAD-dependent oxidoreductase [Bryobacteraceae bacterium]|nr:FAD-dependent oxidoreductase [Bryobacteraceae bacterium]